MVGEAAIWRGLGLPRKAAENVALAADEVETDLHDTRLPDTLRDFAFGLKARDSANRQHHRYRVRKS